jgi:hypothetical protein
LQRLLRGRAAQNEMYSAKTAQIDLVHELRLELERPPAGVLGVTLDPTTYLLRVTFLESLGF